MFSRAKQAVDQRSPPRSDASSDVLRRIAHISDLHFGRTDPNVVAALGLELSDFDPHLVIVTGDLTQRARVPEFEEARRFLSSFGVRTLVVPGNHDIAPVFEPLDRATRPFERYRRYISADLDTTYEDEHVFVAGLNTVAPGRWKDGLIRPRQLKWLTTLAAAEGARLRIIASHHPLVQPASGLTGELVRGSGPLLPVLERAGFEVALSGHLHETSHGPSEASLGTAASLLVVQASTATSTRLRGHANAYNRLLIEQRIIEVHVRAWMGGGFHTQTCTRFDRSERAVARG
jgi:3',5'-cyclic AMP phosphodiesterase CpdA